MQKHVRSVLAILALAGFHRQFAIAEIPVIGDASIIFNVVEAYKASESALAVHRATWEATEDVPDIGRCAGKCEAVVNGDQSLFRAYEVSYPQTVGHSLREFRSIYSKGASHQEDFNGRGMRLTVKPKVETGLFAPFKLDSKSHFLCGRSALRWDRLFSIDDPQGAPLRFEVESHGSGYRIRRIHQGSFRIECETGEASGWHISRYSESGEVPDPHLGEWDWKKNQDGVWYPAKGKLIVKSGQAAKDNYSWEMTMFSTRNVPAGDLSLVKLFGKRIGLEVVRGNSKTVIGGAEGKRVRAICNKSYDAGLK